MVISAGAKTTAITRIHNVKHSVHITEPEINSIVDTPAGWQASWLAASDCWLAASGGFRLATGSFADGLSAPGWPGLTLSLGLSLGLSGSF